MIAVLKKVITLARRENWVAKALCLVLALVLWFVVSSSRMERVQHKIPIEKRRLAANLTVSQMSTTTALVSLEGKKDQLEYVNTKNIRAYVNLHNPVVGSAKTYTVHLWQRNVPEGIYVNLATRDVVITVEKREEKWVRVVPVVRGRPRDGLVPGEVRVIPERVLVSGPRADIRDLDYVYTEELSIENAGGEMVRTVSLRRPGGGGVDVSEAQARVTVPFEENADSYSLELPVVIKNADDRYRYVIDSEVVRVYLSTSGKQRIVPANIEAVLDVGRVSLKQLTAEHERDGITREVPVTVTVQRGDADPLALLPARIVVQIQRKR